MYFSMILGFYCCELFISFGPKIDQHCDVSCCFFAGTPAFLDVQPWCRVVSCCVGWVHDRIPQGKFNNCLFRIELLQQQSAVQSVWPRNCHMAASFHIHGLRTLFYHNFGIQNSLGISSAPFTNMNPMMGQKHYCNSKKATLTLKHPINPLHHRKH